MVYIQQAKLYLMSYSVYLFRKETKEKQRASGDDSFLEKEEALLPFTEEQFASLRKRLLDYGYKIEAEQSNQIDFINEKEGASAMLTSSGVYFSASGEGIFEISMTASEFTDTEEFAKYDPQAGGWEEM